MEWTESEPKFGDIIRTKVTFYHHYGIFVDENKVIQFGERDNVYSPANEIKVLTTNIYDFLKGGELEVAVFDREERKKKRNAKEIVAIAEQRIGEGGYDILHNNCEHFVNECTFGEHTSAFLQNVRIKLRKKLNKE